MGNPERSLDYSTQTKDELQQLRREMLGKIIDEKKKDDFSLSIGKESTIDYLLDEGEGGFKIGKFFKKLYLKVFCKSLKELEEISKEIKNCDTKNELNELQESIINGNTTPTTEQDQTSTEPIKAKDNDNCDHYSIDEFNIRVSKKYYDMYQNLKPGAENEKPSLASFACAMKGYEELKGSLNNQRYMTIVDFTKSKNDNRFYVIDMSDLSVKYATKVGHGHNSGEGLRATNFSNTPGSEQSSLGFLTTSTKRERNSNPNYHRQGLRMYGTKKDNNNNGNAAGRGIFMHRGQKGKNDVNRSLYSQGCFVIPDEITENVLNDLIGGSLLFSYAKSKEYFNKSGYFQTEKNGDVIV